MIDPGSTWRDGKIGFEELWDGLRHWRIWHLLGIRELRHRYTRSRLGQVWLMASTAVEIGVMSVVWSLLWGQSMRSFTPYIGIGLIIWKFLAQILIESTSVFTTHVGLYRNQRMSYAVSILSVIYRTLLIRGHNFGIVFLLVVGFDLPINLYLFQIVPGFLITAVMLTWVGYVVAMLCVRYRDTIQVINTWVMVLFFITPVFWRTSFLAADYHFVVDYNPAAQFLELLRAPLLGEPVALHTWVFTTVMAAVGLLISLPLIGRY